MEHHEIEWATPRLDASIQSAMALDANSVHKPFRKLEKLLKKFRDPPSPEDVHDVRTRARHIEAIIEAFRLDNRRAGRDLTKTLKPIRKAAGNVRDMDVLTDFLASLDPHGHDNCRVQLVEHLANQRTKAASKLAKKVQANVKATRADLKKCRKMAESGLVAATFRNAKEKDKQKNRRKSADSIASTLQIEQELTDWPKLSGNNIHPFRLKVRELRYVLQLARDNDSRLIDALGEVKDKVGLWHDWHQLSGIATQVLDHGTACPINSQIRARTRQELHKALESANHLRAEFLESHSKRSSPQKGPTRELHPDMVRGASRLAS